MGRLDELKIRQLDATFAPLRENWQSGTPTTGWVKTIREALGMSLRQLAERTGMSKTGVASAEKFEAKGTVQMDTLNRLAAGLNCELIYVMVPRDSLQQSLRQQANKRAGRLVGRISDSMDLEAQGVAIEERQRQQTELTEEILRNRGQDFWDV